MSDMTQLIIYQKHYDLMVYSFPIIGRFPKDQRFILGQQIENQMLDIGKMIVHANKLKQKRGKLYEIDIELEKLRHSKQFLQNILAEIFGFLKNVLKLALNKKTQIFPVGSRCVDFLGYRIWPDFRLLRKGNIRRNKRKFKKYQREYSSGLIGLKDISPGIISWLAHCKHADTWHLRNKVLGNLVFTRADAFA